MARCRGSLTASIFYRRESKQLSSRHVENACTSLSVVEAASCNPCVHKLSSCARFPHPAQSVGINLTNQLAAHRDRIH